MAEADSLRLKPYGRAYKPFTIGLSALDPQYWLEPGDDLARHLDEKRRLLDTCPSEVYRAEEDSLAAQREALDMITSHLLERHGHRYQGSNGVILAAGRRIRLDDPETPALITAGSLIEDDLAILIKRNDSWHLDAGFIAFPSSWSLAEKAGKPMEAVHADVPGFAGGTRNAAIVSRIFDKLKPGLPAERFNWSFKGSDALAMPVSKHLTEDPFRPKTANRDEFHAGRAPDADPPAGNRRHSFHHPHLCRSGFSNRAPSGTTVDRDSNDRAVERPDAG